jgi:hypothetical protein
MPTRRDHAGALQCRREREEEDRQKDSRLLLCLLRPRDRDIKRITKKEVVEEVEMEEKEESVEKEAAEEKVDLQLAP